MCKCIALKSDDPRLACLPVQSKPPPFSSFLNTELRSVSLFSKLTLFLAYLSGVFVEDLDLSVVVKRGQIPLFAFL